MCRYLIKTGLLFCELARKYYAVLINSLLSTADFILMGFLWVKIRVGTRTLCSDFGAVLVAFSKIA